MNLLPGHHRLTSRVLRAPSSLIAGAIAEPGSFDVASS